MTDMTLRQYLYRQCAVPNAGIRSCCAPFLRKKNISLRALMGAPRIIHVSDLHTTDSDHTWDKTDQGFVRDPQDSMAKMENIVTFLTTNKSRLASDIVVITGDLTDSGGRVEYDLVRENFIQKLTDNGFDVYAIPGNHDYCWEGNLFFDTAFKAIMAAGIATLMVMPGIALIAFVVCIIPGFIDYPSQYKGEFIALILSGSKDTFVSNETRRGRFIDNITPRYRQTPKYPHVEPINQGYILLLDSMQGELDDGPGDSLAQGKLGDPQLDELEARLRDLQAERRGGKKIIVCLHHSPFKRDESSLILNDADRFLEIINNNKIDCLLFGHTGGFQESRTDDEIAQKIPLINCQNMEKMNYIIDNLWPPKSHLNYPISILDLGSFQRQIFQSDGSGFKREWGNPA